MRLFLQRKRKRLRCGDLQRLLLLYCEETPGDELSETERDVVEEHLDTCDACRNTAQCMRWVTLAVRELRTDSAVAPDAASLTRCVLLRAAERRGLGSRVAMANSWVDDMTGPLMERPLEWLVAFGLVLWLAVGKVPGVLGLGRLVQGLVAPLAAQALIELGLPRI